MKYLTTYYTGKRNKWLPLSAIIRIVQGTKYDHCAFSLSSEDDAFIYESQVWKTHKREREDFFKENEIVKSYRIPITDEEYEAIRTIIKEMDGVIYGVLQIIGLAFSTLVERVMGGYIRNPFGDDKETQVCSEYLARILMVLGAPLPFDNLDLDSVNVTHCLDMNKNLDRSIRVK